MGYQLIRVRIQHKVLIYPLFMVLVSQSKRVYPLIYLYPNTTHNLYTTGTYYNIIITSHQCLSEHHIQHNIYHKKRTPLMKNPLGSRPNFICEYISMIGIVMMSSKMHLRDNIRNRLMWILILCCDLRDLNGQY